MKKIKKLIIFSIILIILILIQYIFSLSNININPNIVILDNKDEELIYVTNNNKSNTVENIDDDFIKLLLFIEDRNFYSHKGYDIKRIFKSIYNNLIKNTKEGASTITQQYIKNTYLTNEKTILRKLKELYLSIKIESILDKNEILSKYLSCIYFGNNVYGIKNAALYYFNKDLNDLSINEKVSIIALLNSPSLYSNDISKWNKKKNSYAKLLYENKIINEQEFNQINSDIILNKNSEYINSNKCYYIDQVLIEFNKLKIKEKFGYDVIIKTKYDKNSELISSHLDINYCAISANKEGYITSIIGDNNYNNSIYNIAVDGNRDIGSTIKPLLYYEAIKCGFKTIEHYSQPYSFKYNNEIITISNSSSNYYNSYINMRTALATSDNVYAVKTHLKLGMNTLVYNLKKYNIEAFAIPSLALGSVGMSLLDLIKIYTQFFDNGYYINIRYIYNIHTKTKDYSFTPKKVIIANPDICNEIRELMAYVFSSSIKYATASSIERKLKMKCYGKSGLTDYDSYMLGFNDNNIVAVWCGDVDNKPLVELEYKRLPKEIFSNLINILK